MKFTRSGGQFTEWKYDQPSIDLMVTLNQSEVFLTGEDATPGLGHEIERLKKLGIGFFTLVWEYIIYSSEHIEIFKFLYKDKYQFKLSDKMEYEDIRKLVATSFDYMSREFDVRDEMEYNLGSIPQPDLGVFDAYCQHTFQFFEKETS